MTNAVTQSYDAAVNRSAMVRLHERRVNGKVAEALNSHATNLDELLKTGAAKKAIDAEFKRAYDELHTVSSSSLIDLMKDQISFQWQTMDAAIGKIWRTNRPDKAVSENFVLKEKLVDNQTLRQGWNRVSAAERTRLEQIIRKGIADKKTVEEIAVEVRRSNIHKITRTQSEALVITGITSVSSQADMAVYEANEKALQGWQYVAVLDTRTSEICQHRDGRVFKVSERGMLPPAHYRCRSTTTPVFKSWEQMGELEAAAGVRRQNLKKLTAKQKAFYDGQTPLRESYDQWIKRQPQAVQLRHLGDYDKVRLLNEGKLTIDKFTNDDGNTIGLKELKQLTYDTPVGDSRRFAIAKSQLDAMQLSVVNVDQLIDDPKMFKTLQDYYLLQSKDLDGNLSLTNYRGALLHTKKAQKARVINSLPTEEQMRFNPITGRYEDVRLYQPNAGVYNNAMRLVRESEKLTPKDRVFIQRMMDGLELKMSMNERAVIADNLRIIIGRQRETGEQWGNLKGVIQAQLKFDIMNISDSLETQLRVDANPFKKLLQDSYIDPVLGPVQLQDLHDKFTDTIIARNRWEDKVAPKIASELRPIIASEIPLKIKVRLTDRDLQQFYLRFAHRLALAELPDKDALALTLGRDLYNLANLNGSRNEWYKLGTAILESKRASKFYTIETYGVQKRRMRSRLSNNYFGPYYDTQAFNLRVVDKRIQEYGKLQRRVDLGLRVSVLDKKNRLVIRPGYKTYFIDRGILGYTDTRIPITSTSSFSDFPDDFIDKEFAGMLNWAAETKYRIDKDFYDFIDTLVYFQDDRGAAKKYNELNEYRKYLSSRQDTYERFKTMSWLRKQDATFSNHPFIDHRARIYDRGLISPQSGETFRPFLNTAEMKPLGVAGYNNLRDQVGAFLGGLDDVFEGNYNSLTITGRQKIADKWHDDLVKIGNAMMRKRPADIRYILDHPMLSRIDGEEQGKFFRLALETAKIESFMGGNYSDLSKLNKYMTDFAIEQDASSSGAQIIAITTKNKQLAELSNVVPTQQKRRLYDEIAARTYSDPRFKELNLKLGLKETDLRKAAKAQNMVTFYGAGERTGMLNVEGKLSKVLGKDENVLVVKASDRDTVLQEIDARIARVERYDPETALELRQLRQNVRDIFNKGIAPGDEIIEELYFLSPQTRDLVEKISGSYERVVTPDDFKQIAAIMSEYLAADVPILKDFTKFFGRLAQDFLTNAKPSDADFAWKDIAKISLLGERKKGYVLPDNVSRILGIRAGEPVSEKVLRRFGFWTPNGTLADIIYGVEAPDNRRVGASYLKMEIAQVKTLSELKIFYANNLPKSWTNVPWVNFDGKVLEQNYTQAFEERLRYQNKDGEWMTNILQVSQKTEATWWEQVINKSGKINDIADATRARTAYAVNGNHSNDAVIVKRFHLWGKSKGIGTSTIHDAFFTNIGDMQEARGALRGIYAELVSRQSVKETLKELRARGLPKELYDKYLEEAIELGIIPIAGKSRIGGRIITEDDILKAEDILEKIEEDFKDDKGWYGVG